MVVDVSLEMLISSVVALISSLGVIFWFFFQRLYIRLDAIQDSMHKQTVRSDERDAEAKKCLHEMEVRLTKRIDVVDSMRNVHAKEIGELRVEVERIKLQVKHYHEHWAI